MLLVGCSQDLVVYGYVHNFQAFISPGVHGADRAPQLRPLRPGSSGPGSSDSVLGATYRLDADFTISDWSEPCLCFYMGHFPDTFLLFFNTFRNKKLLF